MTGLRGNLTILIDAHAAHQCGNNAPLHFHAVIQTHVFLRLCKAAPLIERPRGIHIDQHYIRVISGRDAAELVV